MFRNVPKQHRPNCHRIGEDLTCPKDVPRIHERNSDAYDVFSFLLTHSRDPKTGLVIFDTSLVDVFYALLGVGEDQRNILLVKVLFLVEAVNSILAADAERAPGKGDKKLIKRG